MAIARTAGGWQVTVDVGRDPLTGKRRRRAQTFPTKKAALDWQAQLRPKRSATPKGKTVGDLLDAWLAHVEQDLSPNTMKGYRSKVEQYLRPAFGTLPLSRLTPERIDALYRALRARKGLSPATVRRTHACLSGACTQALRWHWLAEDPTEHVQLPKVRRRRAVSPNVDDVAKVLAVASPWLRSIALLAIVTGARRSELAGLRWSDLHEDMITFARAVAYDGTILELERKSTTRRVTIDADTVKLLRAREAEAKRDALASREPFDPAAYIFASESSNTQPVKPERITGRWRDACDLAKVHVRFHDLRHLSVTTLLDAGLALPSVAGRHGHESGNVALAVYGHAVEAADSLAAEIMGAVAQRLQQPRSTAREP